ncbi:MAG: ImmA/IrrE family metallo-endopeptidase [Chloroflexota bacterium]
MTTSFGPRASVDAIIESLGYNFASFDVTNFLSHVSSRRKRELSVHTVPLSPELFGFWYPTVDTDFIGINAKLHPAHQIHTLLHEIAHILLGHHGMDLKKLMGEELFSQLGIITNQGHLRSATIYDDAADIQEQEAEQFVLLIRRKLVTAHRLRELYGQPTSIEMYRERIQGLDFNS